MQVILLRRPHISELSKAGSVDSCARLRQQGEGLKKGLLASLEIVSVADYSIEEAAHFKVEDYR